MQSKLKRGNVFCTAVNSLYIPLGTFANAEVGSLNPQTSWENLLRDIEASAAFAVKPSTEILLQGHVQLSLSRLALKRKLIM